MQRGAQIHTKFTCTVGDSSVDTGFGRVELPQTYVKLPYSPYSLCSEVVGEGSVGLNHPELM